MEKKIINKVKKGLKAALSAGYRLVVGLYDDKSENVYHILALSKDPDNWEPYRAPRHFTDTDTVALCWWFDEDLTFDNMKGKMIYDSDNKDEINQKTYYVAGEADLLDRFAGLKKDKQDEVLRRLAEAASGNITERWDAPRADH